MAWIELHQTLPRHPKLARLANRLRVTRAQAAGHLTFLWLWALDYAPSGDVSALEPAEISAAADFGGDAELFCQALRESGWLDDDGKIHDWLEYAGRIVTERTQAKRRMRELRERQRVLRERSANVQRTNSERAELPNPTQPNPTGGDACANGNSSADPPAFAVEPTPGFPRTLSEATVHASFVGCSEEFAAVEWHRAVGRGGRDSRDVPIRNWRAYLSSATAYARSRNGSGGTQTPKKAETPEEREKRLVREAQS